MTAGRHSKSYSRAYRAWINMRSRCYNKNTPYYEGWGGRGITVCKRWLESFDNFYVDMGDPPQRHSLDRIDNDKSYSPDNCRWAPKRTQQRNTRRQRLVNVGDIKTTLAEAAERALVPYNTVLYRLKRGWSIEDALTKEAKKGFRP